MAIRRARSEAEWEGLHELLSPAQFFGGLTVSERRGYCRWRFRGWLLAPFVFRHPEVRAKSTVLGRVVLVSPEGMLLSARVYRISENDQLYAGLLSKHSVFNFVNPVDLKALEWFCLNYWLEAEPGQIRHWPGSHQRAIDSVRVELRMRDGGFLYEIS